MVLEEGQQQKVANLQKELTEGVGTDLIKWNFIFGDSPPDKGIFWQPQNTS